VARVRTPALGWRERRHARRDAVKGEGVVTNSVRNLFVVEKRKELRIGATGCVETSVRNFHHSLRNNPEERKVVVSGVNADIG